jgi:hypothetical protein
MVAAREREAICLVASENEPARNLASFASS